MEKDGGFSQRDLERERIADALTAMCEELAAVMKSSAGRGNFLQIIGEALRKIRALRESLTEPFKVAVVGAQGTGKSTLINLLLSEPVMTSHYDETEGCIIKLVYTEEAQRERKASIKYFTDREGVYTEEWIDREEFYKLINLSTHARLKKDAGYRDGIAFFEIYSRNPLLQEVQFINTPGLNTVTADFLQRVRHLFIEADVILWMNKRNQILDSFNTKLISQIYRDNKNIIGVLGFADDLYQSDPVHGVRDVLKEFFNETEKKMVLRRDSGGRERVCFFLYNGLAAESALGMKPDRFISDSNDILPGEEAGLKMLWNYLRQGFPFADEEAAVIDEFSLWDGNREDAVAKATGAEGFDRDRFIRWLTQRRFIKHQDGGYVLTDKGKALSLQSSMLPAIENFAQEVIFHRTLRQKMARVSDSLNRLYGQQNVLSAVKKIRSDYQDVVEEKDRAFANAQKEMAGLKSAFHLRYREWYLTRIQKYSQEMSGNLVKRVTEEMGKRISKKDLWKEFLRQMTPEIFRGKDDGPVMSEISRMIESEFEALAGAKTERLIAEAMEEVRNMITELTPGSLGGEKLKSREIKPRKGKPAAVRFRYGTGQGGFDDAGPNEVMKRLMDKVGKRMSTLVKQMAASDMRKKGMAKFKKLFVRVFRKIFIKLGMDYAKEQAELVPGKGIPFLGWLLIVKDLVDLGLMLNEMLDELKQKLERAIQENEGDFFDHFKKILEPAYREVEKAIFEGLEETMKPGNKEAEEASNGMRLCDQVIQIFETYYPEFGRFQGS